MIPIPVFAFLYGLSIPESPVFLNQVLDDDDNDDDDDVGNLTKTRYL